MIKSRCDYHRRGAHVARQIPPMSIGARNRTTDGGDPAAARIKAQGCISRAAGPAAVALRTAAARRRRAAAVRNATAAGPAALEMQPCALMRAAAGSPPSVVRLRAPMLIGGIW